VQRDQLLDPCHEPRQRLRCRVTTEQLGDRAQRFLGAAGTMLDECQAATRQRHLLASGVEGLPQGHEAFSRRGMSRPPTGRLATQVAACGRRRGGRRSPLCSRTSRASTRCACATSPLLPASRRCPGLLGHGIPGTKPSRVRATVRIARAMRKKPLPPTRSRRRRRAPTTADQKGSRRSRARALGLAVPVEVLDLLDSERPRTRARGSGSRCKRGGALARGELAAAVVAPEVPCHRDVVGAPPVRLPRRS